MLSTEQKNIIQIAAQTALDFNAGTISYAKQAIADNGFVWTFEHENYVGYLIINNVIK